MDIGIRKFEIVAKTQFLSVGFNFSSSCFIFQKYYFFPETTEINTAFELVLIKVLFGKY